MALISCTECGSNVSDKASSCPKCGNPLVLIASGAPAAAPPVAHSSPQESNAASNTVPDSVKPRTEAGPSTRPQTVVLGGILFGLIAVIGFVQFSQTQRKEAAEAAETQREEAAEVAEMAIQSERQRVAQEETEEKARINASPGPYVEASDHKVESQGFLGGKRKLVKVSLHNSSRWTIGDISGEVEYLDSEQNTMAKSAFSVNGSLAAGQTLTFSESSGSLKSVRVEGEWSYSRVRVLQARVLN